MKIEIDTKNDSKDDLAHLAKMLLSLSGSPHVVERPKHRDIFSDEAPASGGLFSMFGDSSQSASSAEQASESGGVFSIFDTPATAPESNQEERGETKDRVDKDIVEELKIVPY